MSKQLLKTYIYEIIKETLEAEKKLRVFDLDDTLMKTSSKVHVSKTSSFLFLKKWCKTMQKCRYTSFSLALPFLKIVYDQYFNTNL